MPLLGGTTGLFRAAGGLLAGCVEGCCGGGGLRRARRCSDGALSSWHKLLDWPIPYVFTKGLFNFIIDAQSPVVASGTIVTGETQIAFCPPVGSCICYHRIRADGTREVPRLARVVFSGIAQGVCPSELFGGVFSYREFFDPPLNGAWDFNLVTPQGTLTCSPGAIQPVPYNGGIQRVWNNFQTGCVGPPDRIVIYGGNQPFPENIAAQYTISLIAAQSSLSVKLEILVNSNTNVSTILTTFNSGIVAVNSGNGFQATHQLPNTAPAFNFSNPNGGQATVTFSDFTSCSSPQAP